VSHLDQPVQAAYENPGLRQSKDRKNECIHDSNYSQNPRAWGSNHHDTEYQESEGYRVAKQHVNVYQINPGDPEQQAKRQCPQSGKTRYPLYDTNYGHEKNLLYISPVIAYYSDRLYNQKPFIQTIRLNLGGVKPSMSPRPYRLGQRQVTTEQTRARIIDAARELLVASDGFSGFSIDAVARAADVARMTVYYQFGSKIGLLEALSDSLAAHGGMEQLAAAFQRPDPLDALAEYIAVFGRFWNSDRLVTRRLRALAALDPDFELVVQARDERRREGLRVIVRRLVEKYARPTPEAFDETVDVLYTLISFECFDTLAGPTRNLEEIAPVVQRLARAVLGLNEG
jgi:AcrR family transcriptional regulator